MSLGIPVWRAMDALPHPTKSQLEAEIVIVGGGPIGLALAIDLSKQGHKVVVLQKHSFIAAGSKAICYSKSSLDILDRLGVGQQLVARGICWDVGKVFWGAQREPIYQFDMLPVKNQKMPGFVNLQQYLVEELLVERALETGKVEIRWGHEVVGAKPRGQGVELDVRTGTGLYSQCANWVVACDGSKSTIRSLLGLDFEGRAFEDNFLIVDIRMEADRPSERWFWFDPPFNPGRTALLHKQPENVWRLDFQLGWEIDRAAAVKPENVDPMIRGMLGQDVNYEPVWYSIYTFQCRRMANFVHGPVIFAGDAAHLVSPFGARGCNGGFSDVANLAWKLDLVVRGAAPVSLLETYNEEATFAADENILHSTRATDFITPKGEPATVLRNAALSLAKDHTFAQRFVNSGRLSTPAHYRSSRLNTPDRDDWDGCGVPPGAPAIDAPLADGWLLELLQGKLVFLTNGSQATAPAGVQVIDIAVLPRSEAVKDRYALEPGAGTLLRPDQYVAARWKQPVPEDVQDATNRIRTNQASSGDRR